MRVHESMAKQKAQRRAKRLQVKTNFELRKADVRLEMRTLEHLE